MNPEINANGTKYWCSNGKYHREDGPAIEHANGDKEWYFHGKIHREDGPAVEYANGDKYWYLNGEQVTQAQVVCLSRQRKLELI